MTQKIKHKVSTLPTTPKARYKAIMNYSVNNDFVFSDVLDDWMTAKVRQKEK